MVKCEICGEKIQNTFLHKILGTYVKDSKGKRLPICQNCQKEKTMEEIKKQLE